MIRFLKAFAGALLFVLAAGSANASMIALVVGNHDYEQVNSLKNPRGDARAISEVFSRIGFEVDTAYNLDRAALTRKINEFRQRAESADTAVFFYAGHGMEIDGVNYLIPTDAVLARQDDAEFEAVRLEMASSAAARASRLSVVLVDACRDNIFGGETRSAAKGFVTEAPRQRQVIAFSTAPGKKAYDGEGDMSPFAQALVEILPTVLSYDVRQVFGGLGARVSELAHAEQEPHMQSVGFSPEKVTLMPSEKTREAQMAVAALPPVGTRFAATPEPDATSRPVRPPAVTLELAPIVRPAGPQPNASPETAMRIASQGVPVAAVLPAPELAARPARPEESEQPLVFAAAAPPRPAPSLAPAARLDPRPQLKDFETFRDCAACPEMIVIPAGRFEMGASTFSFYATDAEFPRHEVEVRRFALARYETTFAEWDACVRDGFCAKGRVFDYGWGRGKQPVLRVAYNDIVAPKGFVDWLNFKAGGTARYRLPTEAEWEYAAAAGSGDDYATGGSITRSAARFGGLATDVSAPRQPSAVGRFPANAWGLHDMHGNVAEMVADCWNDSYDGAPRDGRAWSSGECRMMPVKGGSWADEEDALRLTAREPQRRTGRANRIGFRIAKEIN